MSENQSGEPTKYVLDFEIYLQNEFNAVAGMRSQLKKLEDGQYVVEYESDPEADPLCNANGGKHIVNNLRKIMNRHSAFGSLSKDEIADSCEHIVRATITPMLVWKEKYGVTSISSLKSYGYNTFEGLFAYMTSIKETKEGKGGNQEFTEHISSVQYVPKQQTEETKKPLY